jgi:hypothetical protein
MRHRLVVRPKAELDLIGHLVFLSGHWRGAVKELKTAVRTAFNVVRADPRSCAVLDRSYMLDLELRSCWPPGFKEYPPYFARCRNCTPAMDGNISSPSN